MLKLALGKLKKLDGAHLALLADQNPEVAPDLGAGLRAGDAVQVLREPSDGGSVEPYLGISMVALV